MLTAPLPLSAQPLGHCQHHATSGLATARAQPASAIHAAPLNAPWRAVATFEKENDLWSRGPVLSRVATYEKPGNSLCGAARARFSIEW
jgi:hypothetical protein